ncbi:MAG: hypothetical protein RSE41_01090 [Clostridia bacterium]
MAKFNFFLATYKKENDNRDHLFVTFYEENSTHDASLYTSIKDNVKRQGAISVSDIISLNKKAVNVANIEDINLIRCSIAFAFMYYDKTIVLSNVRNFKRYSNEYNAIKKTIVMPSDKTYYGNWNHIAIKKLITETLGKFIETNKYNLNTWVHDIYENFIKNECVDKVIINPTDHIKEVIPVDSEIFNAAFFAEMSQQSIERTRESNIKKFHEKYSHLFTEAASLGFKQVKIDEIFNNIINDYLTNKGFTLEEKSSHTIISW